jgi:integrase
MTQIRRKNGWASKYVENGEQVWVPGGPWPTKKEAKEAEVDYRRRFKGGATCDAFAERWIEEWPRKSAATRKLYAQAAKRFADEFGSRPLESVERPEARSWALSVPKSVRKIVGTMYEDARNIGLVQHNPFSNLRLPVSQKTGEIGPPTVEEFQKLLAACMVLGGYAEEFRALVTLTAWTGLRASEVMALKRDDFEPRHLNVRRARKDDGTYGLPKGERERRIALPLEARVQNRLVHWADSDFAFHTPHGKPFKKGSLYYTWNKVRDASGTSMDRISDGLTPIRFHDLRHFAATQWLERGASHFDVSVLLGHTDGGQLVMSRYGHPSREAATERLLVLSEQNDNKNGSQLPAERSA